MNETFLVSFQAQMTKYKPIKNCQFLILQTDKNCEFIDKLDI